MTGVVRVVVADDHRVFRDGMASLLAAVPDVALVGTAGSAAEVLETCAETAPDVVLMDLRMPGGGIAATRDLDTRAIAVLVLTMHADGALVREALAAGARGYLLKDSGAPEIIRAIQAVAAGQAIFDPGVSGVLLSGDDHPFPDLTARERDVLLRLVQGLSTEAIAARLGLSAKTVQNNVSRVLLKLGARDRTHAAAIAREAGLTS